MVLTEKHFMCNFLKNYTIITTVYDSDKMSGNKMHEVHFNITKYFIKKHVDC